MPVPISNEKSTQVQQITYIMFPTARIFFVNPPTVLEGFFNPPTISGSIPAVCAFTGLVDNVLDAKMPNPAVIRDVLKNSRLLDLTLSCKGCWNAFVVKGPIKNINMLQNFMAP